MKSFKNIRFLVLFALCFSISSLLADGQSLSPEAQKLWSEYKNSVEMGDTDRISRMIRRSKAHAREVFDSLMLRLSGEHNDQDRDDAAEFAEYLDKALKSKEFTYRSDFMLSLDYDEQVIRFNAWNDYYKGWTDLETGKKEKNIYKLDDASKILLRVTYDLKKINDVTLLSAVTERLAICYEEMEKLYNACVFFGRSIDYMKRLPYEHPDLKYVESRYNAFISQGYDPTKPEHEGGTPSLDISGLADPTSVKSPTGKPFQLPEFKVGENVETATLKYCGMKNPAEFITPGFNTGLNPYLWPGSWFDGRQEPSVNFQPYYNFVITPYGGQLYINLIKNKFYFNINGNEKTNVEIKAITKPKKVVLKDAEKGPDGKPLLYQLFVQAPGQQEIMFNIEQNNAAVDVGTVGLRTRTGCYTKGKLLKENCILIDDNCNGIFGDATFMTSDSITSGDYKYWRPDAIQIGKEKIARPFSQFMNIQDKWYMMESDKFGRTLKAAELEVAMGTVTLAWEGDLAPSYLVLHLVSEINPNFFINIAGVKGPVEIPVGEYELACGKIETKKKGSAKQIRIYHGAMEFIKVFENEDTKLDMGGPFTFSFNTKYVGKNFVVDGKSVNVWGKKNELYTVFFDSVPQPIVQVRNKKTQKIVVKGEKMKLAVRDDFFKDRFCQWHPLDFEYENKQGVELEAKLNAKSVKLLGGPITSEWR